MRIASFFLMFVLLCCFTCLAQSSPNPFSEEGQVSKTDPVLTTTDINETEPLGEQISSGEPTPPSDPLSSATSDGKAAFKTLSECIAKLQEYSKLKDYKKMAETTVYIEKISQDSKVKGVLKPGLNSRMKTGGVDPTGINQLKGKLASLKSRIYNQQTGALLEKANDYEGFSTKKGPGRGNVACAWLLSAVLRAAGIVPPGWNENLALNLTQRMVKEFGWEKTPPTAKTGSGRISSKSMKPGDIIFFSPSYHVGIYLGDGMAFSNSSRSAKGTVHPVSGYYDGWVPRFVVRAPGSKV